MAKQINQILSKGEVAEQQTSNPTQTKTTTNHSNVTQSGVKESPPVEGDTEGGSNPDYSHAINWLQQKGKQLFGSHFTIQQNDTETLIKLLSYFLKDEQKMKHYAINPTKGILLTGPIGCGKTTLMSLMRFYQPAEIRFNIKSCRDISFDFIRDGYEIIHKYGRNSVSHHKHSTWCFDDLGVESNLKYFGNECNVMAEILLSRYDFFVNSNLITHLTTNLSASEIEENYGNRIRSRLREMMNLISFDSITKDKRH